jgi:hypothetical protein
MNAEAKTLLSMRVSEPVKRLIRTERGTNESDGAFIERLVISNVRTQAGRDILMRWAKNHPLMGVIMDALDLPTLPKMMLTGGK